MAPKHLIFALRAGQWVNIQAVPSGLACGCVCPHCGARLQAKKGQRVLHHFAHYRTVEQEACGETALHRWAKQLLASSLGITTPAVWAKWGDRPLRESRWTYYQSAQEEAGVAGLVVDVLLSGKLGQLALELVVSHAAGPSKISRLVRAGLPTLAIDLAAMYREASAQGQLADPAYWQHTLLHTDRHRKWLFHPLKHNVEYRQRMLATPRHVRRTPLPNRFGYRVLGCPLHKRFVRRGPLEGQAYAQVFDDCLHCPHGIEIEYDHEWVGYRLMVGLPKVVWCTGCLPDSQPG